MVKTKNCHQNQGILVLLDVPSGGKKNDMKRKLAVCRVRLTSRSISRKVWYLTPVSCWCYIILSSNPLQALSRQRTLQAGEI